MALRFILGRAGAGKTAYIFDCLKAELTSRPEGPPIIWLVPEQATFQTEYRLAVHSGLGGSIRAEVLSFRRLANRVFLETGGASRVPIGEMGKRMALRAILERQKTRLRVFGRLAGRPGFADCLARSIGELKTYRVSPERLNEAAANLEPDMPLLRDKLSDLEQVYREMEEFLQPRYTDPDDYLNLLADRTGSSDLLKNAEIWVDGFNGFTPQEILVLSRLMAVSPRLSISLCLDGDCLGQTLVEEDLFYPTWRTYLDLRGAAGEARVRVESPVILGNGPTLRFKDKPDLAWVEQQFFTYPVDPWPKRPHSISVTAAANRQVEVEVCAREMIRQAREEGLRWRETAVFLRDLEAYQDLISKIFSEYEIPVFVDAKPRVLHHPLVVLIESALEVVVRNWAYEPLFRLMKTDLASLDRQGVDRLENYVLAHGIRGSRWTDGQPWTYRRLLTLDEESDLGQAEDAALTEINQLRMTATAELLDFWRQAKEGRTVREFAECLYDLLSNLGVPAKIEGWQREAEGEGRLREAAEHAQIWPKVMDLLDEIVEGLGRTEMDLRTFSEILGVGLESLSLGMIPPGLDQVTIATLDRSRNPDLKTAFILGAIDGSIPARLADEGILNDTEREKLAGLGLVLAPSSRSKTFAENFLIYTALTRAAERLWISYPAADEDGRAFVPSPVVTWLRRLFQALELREIGVEPPGDRAEDCLAYIARPRQSLAYLTGWLREIREGGPTRPVLWDLYNWFAGQPDREKLLPLVRSVFFDNREQTLSSGTCQAVYGSRLRTSVSRVEKFLACPFAHFASYALGLQDRRVFRLEAPDMGQLFHSALKQFADELTANSLEWGQLTREACGEIASRVVDRLVPQLNSEILLSSARYRYLTGKLKRAVGRAASVLAEHSRRSSFQPLGLEIPFGPGAELEVKPIILPGGQVLELTGRIDRLDAAVRGPEMFLRVIDYKSSDQQLKLEDIYHGLKLQLLTYLYAAMHYQPPGGHSVRPAGILYFTVKDPLISGTGPMDQEQVFRALLAALKMKGLFLDDPEVFLLMDHLATSDEPALFSAALKKDGSFSARSAVLSLHQFESLTQRLIDHFCRAGQAILGGQVDILPYRQAGDSACTFCSYRSVCKFDPMFGGNGYRVLQGISPETFWAEAGRGEASHEQ